MTQLMLPQPHESMQFDHQIIGGYEPFGQQVVVAQERHVDGMLARDVTQQQFNALRRCIELDLPDPRHQKVAHAMRRFLGRQIMPPHIVAYLAEQGSGDLYRQSAIKSSQVTGDIMSEYQQQADVFNAVQSVRSRLRELDELQREDLDDYIAQQAPPSIRVLRESYDQSAIVAQYPYRKSSSYSDWLIQAPNEQVINFLQWHNHHIEHLNNDPATQERIAQQKIVFTKRVKQAVDEGDMPQSVLAALPVIDDLKVYIGDVFDTEMRVVDGEYFRSTGTIMLSNGAEDRTLWHEFVHAIGGLRGTFFNEPLTEHIAQSLLYGKFDVMGPSDRPEEGTYEERRELVAVTAIGGAEQISIRDFIDAFCEADPDGPLQQDLFARISAAFGTPDINELITLSTQHFFDMYKTAAAEKGLASSHAGAALFVDGAIEQTTAALRLFVDLQPGPVRAEDLITQIIAEGMRV